MPPGSTHMLSLPLLFFLSHDYNSWWRSIVVRPPVLVGELSLFCARLMAGRVTTLWLRRPLSVNQHGQLSQPAIPPGSVPLMMDYECGDALPVPVIGSLPRAVFAGWAVT